MEKMVRAVDGWTLAHTDRSARQAISVPAAFCSQIRISTRSRRSPQALLIAAINIPPQTEVSKLDTSVNLSWLSVCRKAGFSDAALSATIMSR